MTPTTEARQVFGGLGDRFGIGPDVLVVEERMIDGNLPVRIYRPSAGQPLAAIMFYHGGHWQLV